MHYRTFEKTKIELEEPREAGCGSTEKSAQKTCFRRSFIKKARERAFERIYTVLVLLKNSKVGLS